MALRRSGDKPLSEPIMVRLQTHICVTRLQWVKWHSVHDNIKHVFLLKVLWWFWIFEQTLFNVIMRDIVANIIRFVWNHRCITHKILYNSSVGLKCTAIINRMTNAPKRTVPKNPIMFRWSEIFRYCNHTCRNHITVKVIRSDIFANRMLLH